VHDVPHATHSFLCVFVPELLRRKDEQILSLLEEKVHIFRDLGDCSPAPDDTNPPVRERMLFMATPDDVTKGEPIMKDALREGEQGFLWPCLVSEGWNVCKKTVCSMSPPPPSLVETLHSLVSSGVGGAGCSAPVGLIGGSVGPVCLPRRAETFGGFDSHQMNSSKSETHTLSHTQTHTHTLPCVFWPAVT